MSEALSAIRNGEKLTTRQEASLILKLSLPAILAQISSIIMQYIDASMVGHLGAKDDEGARVIVKWGLNCTFVFSILVMIICVLISSKLPVWMGGDEAIRKDASAYFLIYALSIPVRELLLTSQGMIQSSGNIRVPSILNVVMCALDVVFNALLIPRFGVMGAALGTALSFVIIVIVMTYILIVKSPSLHLIGRKEKSSLSQFAANELTMALKIAIPVAIDNIIMGFAYVAFTRIISPFGTVSVAANSFSITAESLCYMPGFGIGVAATTIVGQCIGARRKDLGKRLGWFSNKLLENYFNIHF